MNNEFENVPFEELPEDERIIRTTSSKLIKHFRGLESSGILDQSTTANMIGSVKKLVAIARVRGTDIIPSK